MSDVEDAPHCATRSAQDKSASMDEHPLVFQPLRIAGLLLRNRMVGLPIGLSGFIDGHGAPTERMIALYRRRAAGGAGLITVEIATVEPHACPQAGLLRFDSDQQHSRL